jgi:hypothetical protein
VSKRSEFFGLLISMLNLRCFSVEAIGVKAASKMLQ